MKYGILIALLIVACILGAYVNLGLSYETEMTLRNLGIFKLTINDIDQQKFIMLQWGLLWALALVIFKSNWLKFYFSWIMFCLICHYNFYAQYSSSGQERVFYIFLFLLLYQTFKDKLTSKGITIIYNTIAVVVLLNIVWMVLQKLQIDFLYFPKIGYEGTPIGVYGNTNNSGALIALGLPVFFRKWWYLGLIPCFFGLWLSNAFVSIVGAGVGIMAYTWLTESKMVLLTAFYVIVTIIVGYSITFEKPANFKDGNLRIPFWTVIYDEISKSPIKGYGVGSFRHLFPKMYAYRGGRGACFYKAHNDYAEMVFNIGYTGLLLFLGFIFSKLIKFIKGGKTYYGVMAFVGIVIAMTVSAGHYMIHSTLVLMPLLYLSILNNKKEEQYGTKL